MKVLVTGSNGFIGQNISRTLKSRGHHVVGLARRPGELPQHLSEMLVIKDLFSNINSQCSLDLIGIDAIVHCAWYVNPSDYLTSNENFNCYLGTLHLAENARKAGVSIFLGLGTCFEYELDGISQITTETKLRPNTPYGAAKLATFLALRNSLVGSNTKFIWSRLFYLFGENENSKRLFGYIKNQAKKKAKIHLGPCDVYRDYLDVEDASNLIVDLLDNGRGCVANICSGEAPLLKDLVLSNSRKWECDSLLVFNSESESRPNNELLTIQGKPDVSYF